MRRSILLLCVISVSSHAYELRRDSTGEIVRWGKSAEFVMESDLASEINEEDAFLAIESATNTVGLASPGLTLQLRPGITTGVGYNFKNADQNQNDIVIPEDWPYEENAIAVTVVTVDTRKHEIIDADIAFNTQHRKFKVIEANEVNKAAVEHDDIQNTITHELGHALGLAHNPENPDVVMYPSARKGEIKKRFIHSDDAAGLAFLYPEGDAESASEEPLGLQGLGCSSSDSNLGSSWWLALLFLPLLRRFSPAAVAAGVFCLVGTTPSEAAPLHRADMPAQEAAVVATATVLSTETVFSPDNKLIFTELELGVRECLKGPCEATVKVRVPGGRWQHFEQIVDGLSVPDKGDTVGFALPAHGSLLLKSPRVYRFNDMRDFAAFTRGAQHAGISLKPQAVSPSRDTAIKAR